MPMPVAVNSAGPLLAQRTGSSTGMQQRQRSGSIGSQQSLHPGHATGTGHSASLEATKPEVRASLRTVNGNAAEASA